MRYLGFGNGSDGVVDLSSYTQTWYSCSGSSGATTLTVTGTFNVGDLVYIHQTRGGANVGLEEENQVVSYTAGTLTLQFPLERNYTDSGNEQAQVAVITQASGTTGTYTIPAWDGDVNGIFKMKVSGTADGTINGDGKGFRGGARGDTGNGKKGATGEGTVGASVAGQLTPNGNGGGGSWYRDADPESEGQGSGGGGNSEAGQDGNWYINEQQFGEGGLEVGQADLTTGLNLGGGSGGGGGYDSDATALANGTGRDGGALIDIDAHTLATTLTLSTKGIDGASSYGDQGGAGGSAGGTIRVRCVKNLGATITNTGGAKGTTGRWGGAGADGRTRMESCSNVVGTEDPAASLQAGGHSYCGGSAFLL